MYPLHGLAFAEWLLADERTSKSKDKEIPRAVPQDGQRLVHERGDSRVFPQLQESTAKNLGTTECEPEVGANVQQRRITRNNEKIKRYE